MPAALRDRTLGRVLEVDAARGLGVQDLEGGVRGVQAASVIEVRGLDKLTDLSGPRGPQIFLEAIVAVAPAPVTTAMQPFRNWTPEGSGRHALRVDAGAERVTRRVAFVVVVVLTGGS
jgi:hypothetical protein